MKRILLALAIAGASFSTLSSCTKEYITNNPPGVTFDPIIQPNQWGKLNNDPNLREITLDFPEIGDKVVNQGDIRVALRFTGENGTLLTSYDAIPATINGVHYSYNYSSGRLTLYAEIRTNDTNLDIKHPIQAKVTIINAEYSRN